MKKLRFTIWILSILNTLYYTPLIAQHEDFQTKKSLLVYKLKIDPLKSSPEKPQILQLDSSLLHKISASPPQAFFQLKDLVSKKHPQKMGAKTQSLQFIYRLQLKEGLKLKEALAQLRQDPAIEYAEPLYLHRPMIVPNDPLIANSGQYRFDKIQAYQAWDIEQGDPSVFIGITDNGFNISSADLSANLRNPVLIDQAQDLNNDLGGDFQNVNGDEDNDVSGDIHGQIVSLCVAAVPNNGVGTAGTGYNTPFLPVKVAADDNLGVYSEGYEGILYAAKQGAGIINMSWGRKGEPSQFEQDLLNTVFEDDDVVLIAAAGNDGTEELFYPASYANVLSVAASQASDAKADFSTYNVQVDISAPGQALIIDNPNTPRSGTSYATPLVSGAAALIRAQHPEWSAEQVMARLKTTSDDIYNLSANQAYLQKLGTGRLNMFRALSDPEKAITLESMEFSTGNRGYLFRGDNSTLQLNLKNHLNALNNLVLRISSESPYLNILDDQSILGAIDANTTFSNQSDLMQIEVAQNTPANTPVQLRVQYQDGSYTYTESLIMVLNPGLHDVNDFQLSLGDQGQVSVFDFNFPALSGARYQALVSQESALMVGLNEEQVSDAVRNDFGEIRSDFSIQQALKVNYNSDPLQLSTEARFEDLSNNENRIGLSIGQKSYAWSQSDLSQGLVLEYEVQNTLGNDLDSLFVGIFTNWDILGSENDLIFWDAEQQMAYARDQFNSDIWVGMKLLQAQDGISYYGFGESGIDFTDGFSEAEKYQAISLGIQNETLGQNGNAPDVAQFLGAKIYNLSLGRKRYLSFVLVGGNSQSDLENNAQNIATFYQNLKRGPQPRLEALSVCKGEDVLIQPENGTLFRFYEGPPDESNSRLIHSGSSLFINNLQTDREIYITNIDSIFESPPLALELRAVSLEGTFAELAPELDLSQALSLTLVSEDPEASQWFWEVQRQGGNINEDIEFIEGTGSTSAQPIIRFLTTGNYTIRLSILSTQGCTASSSQDIRVFRGVVTALEELIKNKLQIYPNPLQKELFIELGGIQEDLQLEIVDAQGQKIWEQAWVSGSKPALALNIAHLAPGFYILRLYNEKGLVSLKLIKPKP